MGDSKNTREHTATDSKHGNASHTTLIGTPAAIDQMAVGLNMLEHRPQVTGCFVPDIEDIPSDFDVPVLGGFDDAERFFQMRLGEDVLLSLPLTQADKARELVGMLEHVGVRWRFLLTLEDQLAGRAFDPSTSISSRELRDAAQTVDTVELIGRRTRPLDEEPIYKTVQGRTVLITGAGGSIGSELARMVCRFKPARLVLVERSENALFEIDREIRSDHPSLLRETVLHDVTSAGRTMAMVERHRPDVIFHAAAHKHVPMMEHHPSDAVENNFFGTRSIADAAAACDVDRFVMISTDKAVNPSSVMGASKRLAELYIQWLNQRSTTVFSMVRFGNVLGSACSVLPIWTKQIASGAPVTVTHPQMTRYFMTIPEAAGLVIQSAAYAGMQPPDGPDALDDAPRGGEVFLLDMGDPVNILDLARRFISSRGLEPDVDVKIELTGIRPGEKLFEELAYDGEGMLPTPHESIRIWRTTPPDHANMQQVLRTFERLRDGLPASRHAHPWARVTHEAVVAALRVAVPEMVQSAAS